MPSKKQDKNANSIKTKIEDMLKKEKIIAVLSQPGFNISKILKELSPSKETIRIDLQKMSMSPENFAIDFIGSIAAPAKKNILDFHTIESISNIRMDKRSAEAVWKITNELQKIKPDQELILRTTFAFPDIFAQENNKDVTVIIENFDEILKLNNFSQVKDATKMFFMSSSGAASFVLTTTTPKTVMSRLKEHIDSIISIEELDMRETGKIFEKKTGNNDSRVISKVHERSSGIPLVVERIAERFKLESSSDAQKNIKLIEHILISDIATRGTILYEYCDEIFTSSLNRARGETLLKTILKVMSRNDPMRLTEIARMIYRSGPVTKSLLERLMDVDLLKKDGKTFDFTNPVLKQWCRLMFSNIEFESIPDEKTLRRIGLVQ